MGHAVNCKCGAEYSTPHGEGDATSFAKWHIEKVHSDQYPEGISTKEAKEFVVEA